jgi:molecular chaperone GrpE
MRSSPGTNGDPPADQGELSAEELRAELEQVRAELAVAEERQLRARADLENFRKRAERELQWLVREQSDEVLREWLEVVDSVERAIALEGAQGDGLLPVLDQIDAILGRLGVERVGEVGERFDPERHEAVAVVPRPDAEADTVADVARAGYSAGDRLLRPAQVTVARPRDEAD